jgi:hypothetical protein
VGYLIINSSYISSFRSQYGDKKLELVAIAAGLLRAGRFGSGSVNWGDISMEAELNREWEGKFRDLIDVYYVFWIERKDGVAYRKALGCVAKEAWDRIATEEIDLILG